GSPARAFAKAALSVLSREPADGLRIARYMVAVNGRVVAFSKLGAVVFTIALLRENTANLRRHLVRVPQHWTKPSCCNCATIEVVFTIVLFSTAVAFAMEEGHLIPDHVPCCCRFR